MTGFLPAPEWRSPADTSLSPLPSGTYCKVPQDAPGNNVRGARNIPCVDVPGKRAATPRECRDPKPYVPLGTNPWYGDPNQILNCPAPGARCDQPVQPGSVIPAPSINTGRNPAPADQLPAGRRRPPSATHCSDREREACSATVNSPTPASTPRAGPPWLPTARRAVSWWGPTAPSTRSKIRGKQGTTDGRTCSRRPGEPASGTIDTDRTYSHILAEVAALRPTDRSEMREVIGLGQLRSDACRYLDRVGAGATIDVVRRGKLVARIVSVGDRRVASIRRSRNADGTRCRRVGRA